MLLQYLFSLAAMEVDVLGSATAGDTGASGAATAAAAAATAAANAYQFELAKRNTTDTAARAASDTTATPNTGLLPSQVNPGNLINQCSTAKKLSRTAEVSHAQAPVMALNSWPRRQTSHGSEICSNRIWISVHFMGRE
jgi:hypothetical protein